MIVDEEKIKKIDIKLVIGISVAVILLISILFIIFFKRDNKVSGEIILSNNIKSIYLTEKKKIDAVVRNYDDAILIYKSSDENILKVDNNIIEGINIGEAKLTISCNIDNIKPVILDIQVIDGGGIINSINFPLGELVIGTDKTFDLDKELIVNPSNGRAGSKIFISSNNDVATISEYGILTSKKTGTTNITTTINNRFNSTITVYVIDDKIDGEIVKNTSKIIFKDDNLKLQIGENKKIDYDVYPENSTIKYGRFFSSDNSIVSIDNEGNVKGLKQGKVTISFKTIDNTEYKTTVEVIDKKIEVLEIQEIKLSENEITIEENNSKDINISVVPSNAALNLKITSSNSEIVSSEIKNNILKITGKKEGVTSLTISSDNGKKDTIKVNVIKKKNETTPTPSPIPTPIEIDEREITDKDYQDRGYTISTTTKNLNRTYNISLEDDVDADSSIITFTSKSDKLDIIVCDYLYDSEKCDINKGVHLKDNVGTYEVKGYGMHVISVYEIGKVKISYYIYLAKIGYSYDKLYLKKEDAVNNPIKVQTAITFNIDSDKTTKLKVCWVSENENCNPLTELNTVKPITKINNKLYLNNAKLWKVKVIELDKDNNVVRGPDEYYIKVID